MSEFSIDLSQMAAEQEAAIGTPVQNAPAQATAECEIAFCPTCGKHLPVKGLNFCPFCGSPLPGTDTYAPAPQATGAATGVQEATAQGAASPGEESTTQKLAALPFIKTTLAPTPQREPAGCVFKIVAWIVIIALLTLFAAMVYYGNLD
ncbi:MAG: hypothetical protein Q4B68_00500 [Bacteroidales bacterium]|nr:hypothetical protein [Bacteroidales bacterium]